MATRVVSGIALFVIIGISVLLGALPFGIILMAFSIIAAFGLSRVVGIHGKGYSVNVLEACMYVETVVIYLISFTRDKDSVDRYIMISLILFILALLAIYVFAFPKYEIHHIAKAAFIVCYAPMLLSFGYRVMAYTSHPILHVIFIFLVPCISDISAYFVGSTLGKHKLAPVLSPKKSIEGAVGAVIVTSIASSIYAAALSAAGLIGNKLTLLFAIIGALGSVISQIGDLAASAIKRNYSVKDYGRLIPGHGGIMDRIDSWLVVMPIIYIMLEIFGM